MTGRSSRALPAASLVLALLAFGCEHPQYAEKPLFILEAIEVWDLGTLTRHSVAVDAVCIDQADRLVCAEAFSLPTDPLRASNFLEVIGADVLGPPDSSCSAPIRNASGPGFRQVLRLTFGEAIEVFPGDMVHVHVVGDEATPEICFPHVFNVQVVDAQGRRWYLCGGDSTLTCELRLPPPPRPTR